MKLEEKTILVISPEPWGNNMLSKHHYAILLSKRGNKVYFLPPPRKLTTGILLREAPDNPAITIIEYSSKVFGLSKLPTRFTDWLARKDGIKIEQAIHATFDIIWNFDMYRFQNPRAFSNVRCSILHPVDFVESWLELRAARLYDFVFSVTQVIIDKLKPINPETYFINHGLSEYFTTPTLSGERSDKKISCGYVGNLQSFGLHIPSLIEIISNNPDVEFHFIGPKKSSNLGRFKENGIIRQLEKFKHVKLHDEMHPREVAKAIARYDLFLICYDSDRIGKIASNSHKILEYLSTGKVVVSSRMSTYDDLASGLFEMVEHSVDLPNRFKATIEQIASLNNPVLQEKRKAFALDNTYTRQLQRIESIISRNKA